VSPAPADTGTSTEEVTSTEEATEESVEEATPTHEMTSTEAMTETEGMTPTEEITSTEEMTTAAVTLPFEAVQGIVELAPGAWTPPHTHGGPVLVTILEGEVTERNEMTGEENVYGPGEFWIEATGHLHAAGNAGQENVRLAVVTLLPEGASLTMVEDGAATEDLPGPTVVSLTRMPVTTAAE
jgi:quercetin dioxygenase-like cupin family protein